MIGECVERVLGPAPLTDAEVGGIVDALVAPGASDAGRAGLLVALRARGDRVEELAAFAAELRRRAVPFPLPRGSTPVDVCGTGGGRWPSFNVGTVSAFVLAAGGVPVVKHGNRSARGPTGSMDLVEALGLPATRSRAFSEAGFARHGLAFLHAPLYHPSIRAVGPARRALGIPTIFNRLGPLTNPARVPFQVLGAPDRATARLLLAALAQLGLRAGLAVSSENGADEFDPTGHSTAFVWDGSRVRERRVSAADLLESDDRRGPWGALPPERAADETERLLAGGGGARRGAVLLTSAAAFWLAGRARGLADGVEVAARSLDSGAAESLLGELRDLAASRTWPEDPT